MASSPEVLIMGIIHGLFGVAWMGAHVANELYLLPDIKNATKLVDVPGLRSVKRVSTVAALLGMLTLATGLIFFFVKWGFNTSSYTSDPEARVVLVAFGLMLVTLGLGFGVLKPAAMSIGKRAAALNPMEPFPDDFKNDLLRVKKFLHMSGGLVAVMFILMIVAINGGV